MIFVRAVRENAGPRSLWFPILTASDPESFREQSAFFCLSVECIMIAVGGSRFRRGGIESVGLFIRGPQDAFGNWWTKSPAHIKRPNGESAPGPFFAPRPFVIFPWTIHPDLSHAPQNKETIARCKTETREASARGQTENKEASGCPKTEKAAVLCSSTTRTGSAK